MKKSAFILAALSLSIAVNAQKSKIYTAKEYMRNGDMKKAITAIDEAVANEKTSTDGEAWFTRGEVYEKLAETDATAIGESSKSYMKVLEVKPGYDKNEIDPKLMRIAYKAYNAGVMAMNGEPAKEIKPNYDAAYSQFQEVVDIRNINNGKHFEANKKFDTIAAQAQKFQGLSAFYGKKNDLALTALNKAKANPAISDVYIYTALIDIYAEKNDNANLEATFDEAKKKFPKNDQLTNQEIAYYQRVNKVDILIKKMEEAIKADPNNDMLQFNLGALYSNMANPRDAKGELAEKPANSKDLEAKAVNAYKYAIDGNPNIADYHFNLGVLYFNNAADISKKMNAITGMSDAENKKYEALKKLRSQEYTNSLPSIQKSYDILSAKINAGTITEEEKVTYRGTLTALRAIYNDFGQAEKSAEISKKIAELK